MNHAAVQTTGFLRGTVMRFNTNDPVTALSDLANDGAANHAAGSDHANVEDLHDINAARHAAGESLKIASTPRSRHRNASLGLLMVHTRTGMPWRRLRS